MSASTNYPTIRPSLLLDFSNTEQLDPRITFARSTTATYYDDNTVAKAEENLLLQSQTLDVSPSWSVYLASITANTTTAPDGTATADSLTSTSGVGTDQVYQTTTITSGVSYTYSIYAKYSNAQFIRVRMVSGITGNPSAWFDIQNGALGTVQSGLTASIVSVGSGWYRCIVTFTPTGTSNSFSIYPSNADGSSSQAIGQVLYLWGAQLEQRNTVTAYTATTSAPITNYIPVLMTAAINEARLDHNPTTRESLGLLIEESRTNLLTYSEQFDNAVWEASGLGLSVSTASTIAPNGTLAANTITATSGGTFHQAMQSATSIVGTAYTISIYAKAKTANYIYFAYVAGGGSAGYGINVDLITGAVTATRVAGATGYSHSVTSVGNGWWKIALTAASINTAFFITPTVSVDSNAPTTGIYKTFSASGSESIYIWGAQLEAGSFPTSYIPTVASQVTRSADSASMTGSNFSSWYRADEGTIYSETNAYAVNGSNWAISDGSTANRIISGFDSTYNLFVSYNAITQAQITVGSFTVNSFNKVAASYKTNDFAVSLKGSASGSDTSGIVPTVNQFQIGGGASNISGSILNGTIKRIAYYPARLTNAQLQALTS